MNISPSIGDRPLGLASYLRAAVDKLLDTANTEYNWSHFGQCNCGLLARCAIPEMTPEQMRLEADTLGIAITVKGRYSMGWTGINRNICELTDLPVSKVLTGLSSIGVLPSDIKHLEYLSHPELMKSEWDLPPLYYASRTNVAYYLQRWAEAIEKFHSESATQPARASEDAFERVPQESAAVTVVN